jgi:hypothetical protein
MGIVPIFEAIISIEAISITNFPCAQKMCRPRPARICKCSGIAKWHQSVVCPARNSHKQNLAMGLQVWWRKLAPATPRQNDVLATILTGIWDMISAAKKLDR